MPITSKIVPHAIGILFFRGIYRHAKLSSLSRQHLINTLFSWLRWVVFVLLVFPFPYSSFVIVCLITGMSFGAGSGSSYHSGNGFGVGSPLRHSSSNKGGFWGSCANERPVHQVDYVEKDPKGRYVRVIHSTLSKFWYFIEIFCIASLLLSITLLQFYDPN